MSRPTDIARPGLAQTFAPVVAVVAAMASIQVGAAMAQQLFPVVGAQGATALRVTLAALILLVLRRPSLKGLAGTKAGVILAYGGALGVMNLMFYLSLARIPLGVAVAVEFTGPLVVSALSHRSRLDLLWLGLAAAGLVALAPLGPLASGLDPVGLAFALAAGACWAIYILVGRKAGDAVGAGAAVALGMTIAACIVLPVGAAHAGAGLLSAAVLPIAAAVAVLSSALPYSLEMYAMTRLPRATFGILMSLEPAVGALAGWILLGQGLSPRQGMAVAAIVLASAGAASSLIAGRPEH